MHAPLRVIINADDFGYCHDSVEATIDCFRHGAASSATIMAFRPGTEAAAEFARAHPHFSFGVHLAFCADGVSEPSLAIEAGRNGRASASENDGRAGAGPGPAAIRGSDPQVELDALVNERGELGSSNALRLRGLLNRLDVADLCRSIRSQIERVQSLGVPISHVDSHGHLHKYAPFRRALARVLPRFGINRVRTVQNVYLTRHWHSLTWWLGQAWAGAINRAFITTEYLFLPSSTGERRWVQPLLERVTRGTLEVGLHPGREQSWRRQELTDAHALAETLHHRGIPLVNWTQVQRPGAKHG